MSEQTELIIGFKSKQELYFKSDGEITAASLADNLLGLQGVADAASRVIQRWADIKVKQCDVLIESISLQSYKDNFVFRLIFGTGRKAELKLEKFRDALRLKNVSGDTLAKFAIAGAILYAAWKLTPSASKDAQLANHFENSFNNMAIEVGMTGDEAKDLFETVLRNEEQLKKDVMKLTRPDGQKLSGAMVLQSSDGSGESIEIPSDVIDSIPAAYEREEKENPTEAFEAKDIVLRAVDLDRPENGWWVIVPELTESRLPASIGEDVNPARLPVGKLFTADIEVEYSVDKHGNKKPKRVIINAANQ